MSAANPAPDSAPGVPQHYRATDWATLLSPDRPERQWTVNGLIPEGGSVSLVASAKSGKSQLARSIALAIALDWGDIGGLPVDRGHRVLYVDLENSDQDWADTLHAAGVTPFDSARLTHRLTLVQHTIPPLDCEPGAHALLDALDEHGIRRGDLVILDSAQRIVDGKEDASDTWRAYHRLVGQPLRALGVAALRLDNTGHNGTTARGSSSKRDDVDIEWSLTRPPRSNRIELKAAAARLDVPDRHAFIWAIRPGIGHRYTTLDSVAHDPFDDYVARLVARPDLDKLTVRAAATLLGARTGTAGDALRVARERAATAGNTEMAHVAAAPPPRWAARATPTAKEQP